MYGEIKFTKETAHKSAGKWRWSKGLAIMAMDTLREPSPNGTKVVNLSPIGKNGLSGTEIELPIEQLPEIMAEMMKVAGIDIAEFAKNVLVANGYVNFFVSSEEVRAVATDMQRELTDEELADVVEFLSHNDLETGLCELAIEGAISEVCPDATDQEWDEDDDEVEEEDESGIEYLRSIGKK